MVSVEQGLAALASLIVRPQLRAVQSVQYMYVYTDVRPYSTVSTAVQYSELLSHSTHCHLSLVTCHLSLVTVSERVSE